MCRLMQTHNQVGDEHILATSPLSSSFIIVDTLLENDHPSRDSLSITSPMVTTGSMYECTCLSLCVVSVSKWVLCLVWVQSSHT